MRFGTEHAEVLHRALDHGDTVQARYAVDALFNAGQIDDALQLTAEYLSEGGDVVELFIEALDRSGTVHRFAGALLLDKSAVDDVAQDSLISIAQSANSYRGKGKVTTWVHSIVRNRVVDHIRRQRETVELTEEVSPAARMSSIIATRSTVQTALESLPEKYRTVVVLRDIEGIPYADIAQQTGCSLGTVKSQISRGRAMVASRIQGLSAGEQTA